MESIENQILQLESNLLKSEIIKSSQKISEILANEFIEFCSSGSEYHYKKGVAHYEKIIINCLWSMYK